MNDSSFGHMKLDSTAESVGGSVRNSAVRPTGGSIQTSAFRPIVDVSPRRAVIN